MFAANQLTCHDSRLCFAKREGSVKCGVLIKHDIRSNSDEYEDGKCPFCKPLREYTNGKKYVKNKNYISI